MLDAGIACNKLPVFCFLGALSSSQCAEYQHYMLFRIGMTMARSLNSPFLGHFEKFRVDSRRLSVPSRHDLATVHSGKPDASQRRMLYGALTDCAVTKNCKSNFIERARPGGQADARRREKGQTFG